MSQTHYLITGGAGFIGCNYVRFLLAARPTAHIVVFDKLTYAGRRENLQDVSTRFSERFGFIQGDICDEEAVNKAFDQVRPDIVVNFAAETHVDRSITNPKEFVRTDVLGTFNLLQAAVEYGNVRFHQISTDEVYGPVEDHSRELDVLRPSSPYSASKAGGDLLALAFQRTYDLPVTVTRGANCVGPFQYPEKVVPLFATNAILDMPLPMYGDGQQKRDFQYVMDHCAGIQMVLDRGKLGEIYNIGTGTEVTNLRMAQVLLDELGKPHSLIQSVADRPGHDRRYGLDISKILQLGWAAAFSWEESIRTTVRWYAENEDWWRPIREGAFKSYYKRQYDQHGVPE